MEITHQTLDWNSSDILIQIAQHLQSPLASIIEANERAKQIKNNEKPENVSEIIFSNSQEISRLIKEVTDIARSRSIQVSKKQQPIIFDIYNANPKVKHLCKEAIQPNNISITDHHWLVNFETEVFDEIKSSQVNLQDLSYKLAISERQLHRKIKNLLHLTPNKYIRILKLYKAKELLSKFMYNTVSEVAYAVGYYDTHYFSKLFYQHYGITPKEFIFSHK
ncbi:helix-turn-helix domain-containing protein [Aquimarina sp. 2201CG1-2-11]|uniref:helix-turn-helix domain-containing protein n=1 Tax=Aquimarina discodermiae TaxID=3231043 RepID=UPI0034630928